MKKTNFSVRLLKILNLGWWGTSQFLGGLSRILLYFLQLAEDFALLRAILHSLVSRVFCKGLLTAEARSCNHSKNAENSAKGWLQKSIQRTENIPGSIPDLGIGIPFPGLRFPFPQPVGWHSSLNVPSFTPLAPRTGRKGVPCLMGESGIKNRAHWAHEPFFPYPLRSVCLHTLWVTSCPGGAPLLNSTRCDLVDDPASFWGEVIASSPFGSRSKPTFPRKFYQ